jgi:hypothetical protein
LTNHQYHLFLQYEVAEHVCFPNMTAEDGLGTQKWWWQSMYPPKAQINREKNSPDFRVFHLLVMSEHPFEPVCSALTMAEKILKFPVSAP